MNILVGMQFNLRGKNTRNDIYTVVDIHTTTNIACEIVGKLAVAEHEFCGQVIRTEHPISTVIRGLITQ